MYIIVGLGNPDAKYRFTRHNVGFHAIEFLAENHGVGPFRRKCQSLVGEGRIGGQRVALACPQTYMNLSGRAIVELMNWYKCPPENVIIIYDDADLEVGAVRVRASGSAGTHNGMKNIIYLTRSDRFPRIRVGIGKRPAEWDMADYVLSVIPDSEKQQIKAALDCAVDAAALIVSGDIEEAQRRYNKKARPEAKSNVASTAGVDAGDEQTASARGAGGKDC